jgi:DNA-binding PadR family transcriptional regulator
VFESLDYVSIEIYIICVPDRPRSVERFLPLKPRFLQFLLSLADEPRHGYAIMQEVLERTGGKMRLWPAALYGSIRELEKLSLIEEPDGRPSPDEDDERRRYYRLTALGRQALDAEIRRLEDLVAQARAKTGARKTRRA